MPFSLADLAVAQADVLAVLEEHGHSDRAYRTIGFDLGSLLEVSEDAVLALGQFETDPTAQRYAFVSGALIGVRLGRPSAAVDAASVARAVDRETEARGGATAVLTDLCSPGAADAYAYGLSGKIGGGEAGAAAVAAAARAGLSFGLLAAALG